MSNYGHLILTLSIGMNVKRPDFYISDKVSPRRRTNIKIFNVKLPFSGSSCPKLKRLSLGKYSSDFQNRHVRAVDVFSKSAYNINHRSHVSKTNKGFEQKHKRIANKYRMEGAKNSYENYNKNYSIFDEI